MQPLPVIFVLLLSAVNGQYDGCIDPPGNNALATLIVNALESLRPLMVTGVPDLGIPPLDPLGPLFNIPFHIDVPHIVKMDGSVNKTYVMNFSEFFTCSLNLTIGLSQKFAVEFRLENFHLEGLYDVNGLIASLFPVFGNGTYTLDTYNTGMYGAAKLLYNPLSDHASIKNLKFDIFFEELELVMECIMGCGEMADLVNGVVSEIAPPMFFAIWDAINPALNQGVEDVINKILKNISISDLIPPGNKTRDLGNANTYMDLILFITGNEITKLNLDPAPMPNATFSLAYQSLTELFGGELLGLSSIHRSGTSTFDTVADWKFLYANIGFDAFTVNYKGVATGSDGTVKDISVMATLDGVSIYMTARGDTYSGTLDLDQFVVSEFGKIDVHVGGLGVMGYLTDVIVEAVTNSVRSSIAEILGSQIKDVIQQALHENPWNDALAYSSI